MSNESGRDSARHIWANDDPSVRVRALSKAPIETVTGQSRAVTADASDRVQSQFSSDCGGLPRDRGRARHASRPRNTCRAMRNVSQERASVRPTGSPIDNRPMTIRGGSIRRKRRRRRRNAALLRNLQRQFPARRRV